LLAFGVGGILVGTYQYKYIQQENLSYNYEPFIDPLAEEIIFGLGAVQAVTSFMLVVGFLINKSNLIIRAGWRERVSEADATMFLEKQELRSLREETFAELEV